MKNANQKVRLTLRFRPAFIKQIKIEAVKLGMHTNDYIEKKLSEAMLEELKSK